MTAATMGTATASAGRPDPISAPASSVIVPPGSSTAGTATISTTTATHSTVTAAAVGSALSADGKAERPQEWRHPGTDSYYSYVEALKLHPAGTAIGAGQR